MTDTPVVLIVFLALGTVAVVLALLLVRSRQELSRSQLHAEATGTELEGASRYAADLGARLTAVEAELRHLVEARIPDLATSLAHSHVPVPGPLGTATLSPELDRSIDAVLAQVREEVDKERHRVDAAAQAAMRGATTTIQALLYQLQTLLQRMQEKYEDPLVAEDLLAADFLNEQALRRIQSTAVVCGAWPGLTRENSHLADVVVGASSRLSGYERVQITNLLRDPVGVIARAVEPVAVTLTELMANALHHSHPELPVAVTLQQGNRGVSLIIDDSGVGMNAEEFARAKRLMSGDEAILVTELGDPPRTGFAAIGQLVRQYGFSTHVEASPYGGVRAVVHLPGEPLLTLLDEAEHPMSAMAPSTPHSMPVLPGRAATDARSPAAAGAPTEASTVGPTASGDTGAGAGTDGPGPPLTTGAKELPRRRRRHRADGHETANTAGAGGNAAGEPAAVNLFLGSQPGVALAPPSTPEESAERWSAFQKGTASGRAAAGTVPPRTPGAPGTDSSPEEKPGNGPPRGARPARTEESGKPELPVAAEKSSAASGTGGASGTGEASGTREASDAKGTGDTDNEPGSGEASTPGASVASRTDKASVGAALRDANNEPGSDDPSAANGADDPTGTSGTGVTTDSASTSDAAGAGGTSGSAGTGSSASTGDTGSTGNTGETGGVGDSGGPGSGASEGNQPT